MTILQILLVLILAVVMLIIGINKKKKWLSLVSIIPFAIVLWQFIIMFSI
jgi:hypothetical protein